jgi:acyl-CoA thioester hydrolase
VKHTTSFRIRYEECDRDGFLKGSAYLSMMQETAFNASAAAGYGQERYRQIERTWLIRRTSLELLLPVVYGDELLVTTWVADFHRVRSIRAYEFHRNGGDNPLARAYTDWVFIDTNNGRPVSIPAEITAAYQAKPDEHLAALRVPFACPAPPAKGAYSHYREVSWNDIDPVQHVNNSIYLAYFEDSAQRAIEAQGISLQRLFTDGFLLKPIQHQIEYRLSAVWGDELAITTWICAANQDAFQRCFILQRRSDAEVIARAISRYVWFEKSSMHKVTPPDEFFHSLPAGIPELCT